MKLSALAMTLPAILSAGAIAADSEGRTRNLSLREVVPYLEARYGGEVVAVALDASGDKPAHYHVAIRYPDAGTAKLDVDAATLEISGRNQPAAANGWMSLANAAAYASTQLDGQVVAAELDALDAGSAHYDVDVRLAGGDIARLKIDAATRQLGWRTPPIVAD